MQYRTLGKTGLRVSEVGFGAEWLGELTPEESTEVINACHAGGINILDCWMSDPDIRSKIGAAIEPMRDEWIIQGHIGSTWQDGQYVRTREMTAVRAAFEDQLERLRTDHVELGMIHYVDEPQEFADIMAGEFFEYVTELFEQGKIEHIGLSTHNPDVALAAVHDGRIEMIMFSVNPAFDLLPATPDINVLFAEDYDENLQGMDPARAEVYAECERANVGITVMKGYAGGRLLDAEKSPFGVAMTPVQCLHYALTRPAVASVLIGIKGTAELDEALAYETATPEQLDYASILAEAPKHAYFGQCIYCGHCAPCVVGINIAMVNKFCDLAVMQDEVPASVKAHYEALDVQADECLGCHDCGPRCPFGVPIAERMEQAATVFA